MNEQSGSVVQMTLEKFLNRRDEERHRGFDRDEDSGLFLGLLKRIFGQKWLHWCWGKFARWRLSHKLGEEMSERQAERLEKYTLECYSIVTIVILLVCYTALFYAIQFFHRYVVVIFALVGVLVALFRIAEILSFLVQLHSVEDYQTTARTRAVARTFWHYLEFMVAFGVLYLVAYLFGDSFSSQPRDPFLESWVTPLYFSLVTISTLGYGDFSPQCLFGRLTVMFEIVLGLILFLIVLQRALAAPSNPPSQGCQDGGSESA
jgi:Ion channel